MYLNVSSSPHIRDSVTTRRLMGDVVIALIPALVASYFIFGVRAIILTLVTVASCVFFEWISRIIMKRDNTIHDMSAVVTGTILAFCLPAGLPVWMAIFGAFIAIVVVKEMFGGIGSNIANPAIVGRIVLGMSFGSEMNSYSVIGTLAGETGTDLVATATPLALSGDQAASYLDLLLGRHGGTIGEVSAAALLLGCAYLVLRGVIDLWIPATFVVSTGLFMWVLGHDPIYHVLAGGLLLGAIYMATDYVTSPTTTKGKIIFGIGCGLLTGLFRGFAASPEGVSFAILLMNIMNPHLERWTRLKTIGGVDYVA